MTHLRLKRLFLLSLVISLTACAAVAIGALLLSQFNRTTGRILGTLFSLGFHSGMAMWCAATLEKQRRPALSMAGLVLFAASFAWMMVCLWWPEVLKPLYRYPDECMLRSIATTAALAVVYVLLIPCCDLAHAGRWRPLPQAGVAVCAVAFGMTLVCIWAERTESKLFGELTAVGSVMAFSFAHQCLLGRVPIIPAIKWLASLAGIGLWAFAAMLSFAILTETLDDDVTMRLLGAVGVLDAVSSIALVIMVKVKGVEKIQGLESTPARLDIRCPRCEVQQVVDAGASKCASCGLRFRIEIEEPRCATCGYLLWRLPERRCPECGKTF
jgi:hypothetical protein